jgi:hypothetical protein
LEKKKITKKKAKDILKVIQNWFYNVI